MTRSYQVPGGAAWSCVARRDDRITLTALGADAVATMLLYAADDPAERLNIPDTLKAQMSMRVVAPMVLMSQRGGALASVVESTLDWHDAVTGYSHPRHLERFGRSSYQVDRNGWRRDGYRLLLTELYTRDLGDRDLHAPVNWFVKVAPDADASLAFVAGHAADGDNVVLRAERDLLIVLATAQHPLDPRPVWAPAGCRLDITAGRWPDEHPGRSFRDESARSLDIAAGRLG